MSATAASWRTLTEGAARFAAGEGEHPHQDPARRQELAGGQHPVAAILSCSDSRVPPEVVFDLGLGDGFTIRNAGQVMADDVVGSLEYAVGVLGVPLVVVLRHSGCGAVRSGIDVTGREPARLPPHIARLVSAVEPAVLAVAGVASAAEVDPASLDAEAVGRAHLENTVRRMLTESELVSAAVADGSVTVVGAAYSLADGTVTQELVVGALDP